MKSKSEIDEQLGLVSLALPFTDDETAYSVLRGWIAALRWVLGRGDVSEIPEEVKQREVIAVNLTRLQELEPGDAVFDGVQTWDIVNPYGRPLMRASIHNADYYGGGSGIDEWFYIALPAGISLLKAAAHAPGFRVIKASEADQEGGAANG